MLAWRIGSGTNRAGPPVASSEIVTNEPFPFGLTVISTRALPTGHPRASSTRRLPGSISSTSVLSSINAGHTPNEWCSLLPTAGQPSSTSRIRDAPTTQRGYIQPSLSTANTCSGEQFNRRCSAISAFPSPHLPHQRSCCGASGSSLGTESALIAPRSPSGCSSPLVVSATVCCSDSALISAPSKIA
jgi:hypothetical protein